MGMKDWLDKLKQKAEDHNKEETDPAKIRAAKKEANERTMKRTAKAIELAQKGLKTYNNVSKKVGDITDAAAEKTAELAEKAKPAAEKIDGALEKAGHAASGAFNAVKNTVTGGIDAAGKKLDEAKNDNAGKPSSGSSLLDFIAPAIPENAKPKKDEKKDAPKP